MGNTPSTVWTHENEMEEEMKNQIVQGASANLYSHLSNSQVSFLAKNELCLWAIKETVEVSSDVARAIAGGNIAATVAAVALTSYGSIGILMTNMATALFPLNLGFFFGTKPTTALSDPVFWSTLCSLSTPIGHQIRDYMGSGIFR